MSLDPGALRTWRDRWTATGFPAIPLRPGTKSPEICKGWQTRPPSELWHEVGPDFAGNIGVRLGGGNCVIDCDAPKTREAVERHFENLGIEPDRLPVQATATVGHCQYFVRVNGVPDDAGNWCKLPADTTGPGELRYGTGAQCAVPCSVVGDRAYQFERGWPELIPALPAVAWADLLPLLGDKKPQPAREKRAAVEGWTSGLAGPWRRTPIPLLHRDMPARARFLLERLETAPKGEPLYILDLERKAEKAYDSRSEAETAVVSMLILAGWDLEEIERCFYQWKPGHWASQHNRTRCLQRKFDTALSYIVHNPARRTLAELYQAAQSWPWPGRGGAMERGVYLGLLAIGWQGATWQPYASRRDLSEHAATSRKTVGKALERLLAGGLVEMMTPADRIASQATQWDLSKAAVDGLVSKIPHMSHVGVGGAVSGETWAQVGRGEKRDGVTRSPELVYHHLEDDPLDVGVLVTLTGKSRRTVYRALDRLRAWELAESVEGGWVRSGRSLADVAVEVDAAGRARERHQAHERQRGAWREFVEAMSETGGQVARVQELEPVEVGDGVPLGPGWPWGVDK